MQKRSKANLLPVFLEIYLTKDTNNNVMPNAPVFFFFFFPGVLIFMRLLKQVFTESTLIYAYLVVGKG